MQDDYPGTFHDRHGTERITIRNDGQELSMAVRGVKFSGRHIMGMEPTDKTDRQDLAVFTLNRYPHEAADLCACTIEYEMALPVSDQGRMTTGPLTVHSEMGEPIGNGSLDREFLRLALRVGGETYQGSGTSGWFEDELLEIQAALPEDVYIKACINCAFSDYSVYGHDIFGDMACFRRCKSAYLAVGNKRDYMGLQCPAVDTVQETYLCPEFERRRPGTGYRG